MKINNSKSALLKLVLGASVLLLSGGVALAQQQVNLTAASSNAAMPDGTAAQQENRSSQYQLEEGGFGVVDFHVRSPASYRDSSMTNSRESTSIIISMPPGNMLFVVISRSLCECHMNA